ncbi:MAG: hypothetical protein ACOYXT_29580, partial [Bacteroidota bacterium]
MRRTILLIILSACTTAVYSQDTAPSKLTFKDAVKIGLEKNMTLRQQKNLLVSSKVAKTSG